VRLSSKASRATRAFAKPLSPAIRSADSLALNEKQKSKKWQKGKKRPFALLPLFAFLLPSVGLFSPTRPRAQPNSVQIGLRAVGVSD
jgi:hypothetical protein